LVLAMAGQNMTDEGGRQAFDQLKFFMAERITQKKGFIALGLIPAGLAGPRKGGPTGRLSVLSRRSGCVPAEPYPPLKLRHVSCRPWLPTSKKQP
jgi:hypothetical protein